MVFIATPHKGSKVDRGKIGKLGSRLVRIQDPLRASHNRLIAQNPPDFFTEEFRKGIPTSVDELEWHSPILLRLNEIGIAQTIKVHSIIADLKNPPGTKANDGLVAYESAHVEGALSELLVSSAHLCQEKPAVIQEVRRILLEHDVQSQ